MLRSLVLECDPVDQPDAVDPLERKSWSAFRMRIGHRAISRMWDPVLDAERWTLYVPTFPIAEWLVHNWWAFFHEPCRTEALLSIPRDDHQLGWLKRHSLRCADSSLRLPALAVFNDGRGLRAEWRADAERELGRSCSSSVGEFLATGGDQLDLAGTQDTLSAFIETVIGRVSGVDVPRVSSLCERWKAIKSAEVAERDYCVLAGRLGLDPYSPTEIPEPLAILIESEFANPELPLARDLFEVSEPDSLPSQWEWIQSATNDLGLRSDAGASPTVASENSLSPPEFGYELARRIRKEANVPPNQSIPSIESLTELTVKTKLRVEERNHIPGRGIRAIVGSARSGEFVYAGPQPRREDNRRFLTARGLYHLYDAATSGKKGYERLVTDAFSWDQKASGAFAAELLAPQEALAEQISTVATATGIQRLADEFTVSSQVIERQLQNAGISVDVE